MELIDKERLMKYLLDVWYSYTPKEHDNDDLKRDWNHFRSGLNEAISIIAAFPTIKEPMADIRDIPGLRRDEE